MNKCHFLNQLSSYIDNALFEKDRIRLEEHLAGCPVCRKELETLKALSANLKEWQVPSLDQGFDVRVREKIVLGELEKGGVQMERKHWKILVPAGVFVTIIAFVIVGQLVFKQALNGKMRYSLEEIADQNIEVAQINQKKAIERVNRARTEVKRKISEARDKFDWDSRQYEPYYAVGGDGKAAVSPAVSQGLHFQAQGAGDEVSYAYTSIGTSEDNKVLNRMSFAVMQDVPEKDSMSRVAGLGGYVAPNEASGQGTVIVIQPMLPVTGEGDKIIRTATVQLLVENGKEAYKKAAAVCQEMGGYLATSNFYKDTQGREAGTITMRIPKDKFTATLDRLGTLGVVENMNSSSQDVSREYAALKTQLDAAMVVYNKMFEALQKKQVTIPEAMRLESELTPILARVEGLKNAIEGLNNVVSFTTINVSFHEKTISEKTLKESTGFIHESLLSFGIEAMKFIAVTIPVAIVGGIILVIVVVLAFVLKAIIKRLLKK